MRYKVRMIGKSGYSCWVEVGALAGTDIDGRAKAIAQGMFPELKIAAGKAVIETIDPPDDL